MLTLWKKIGVVVVMGRLFNSMSTLTRSNGNKRWKLNFFTTVHCTQQRRTEGRRSREEERCVLRKMMSDLFCGTRTAPGRCKWGGREIERGRERVRGREEERSRAKPSKSFYTQTIKRTVLVKTHAYM